MRKDKNELFKHLSDETVEKISAEYPTGDKIQRDRIYREIERRVDDSCVSGEDVRGVEAYRSRPYMRIISAAAAFVIIVGAAAGGGYIMRNGSSNYADNAVSVEGTTAPSESPTEPETTEAAAEPAPLTKEEILDKITNRRYDDFNQINIEYTRTTEDEISEHGIAKRDCVTGNESCIKTFYYKNDGTMDAPPEWTTTDEIFAYKDLYICIYSDTSDNITPQYEVMNRSAIHGRSSAESSILSNLPDGYMSNGLEDFDLDEVSDTVFLGRECTSAVFSYHGNATPDSEPENPDEPFRPAAEDEPLLFDVTTNIIFDNETGIVLDLKNTVGTSKCGFTVDSIRFNEDAELPENGTYIKNRIAECEPVLSQESIDLSILDEEDTIE